MSVLLYAYIYTYIYRWREKEESVYMLQVRHYDVYMVEASNASACIYQALCSGSCPSKRNRVLPLGLTGLGPIWLFLDWVHFGVFMMEALLFGVYIMVPDFWKLPCRDYQVQHHEPESEVANSHMLTG